MAMLHATCIAIGGRGVLLMGRPGSGKSDLAFRLIDRGAVLVADDSTTVEAIDGRLRVTCPATIAGQIEIRGVGIVTLPTLAATEIALCVSLDESPERMPPDPLPTIAIEGLAIPKIALAAFESSAPLKLEKALLLYGLVP
ncbi:serine kinase of HPr protein (carbohydrate metabolism regulator) [Sphingomonas vulcanisoli]|uniref:Serine kinase of HPr protein (Carbohydrate metabolism regulator) n=1 Tax=Sphingomonas vulcanisoli TaxID=1658060 RepID=A0ABX0TWM8_9SPHN|nr:HPr kinase/phosphatase C-terminal domain-containing protein [Sphingomonas vulcanisoli]NIJ08817.1 serine kinase of HPr protein (carbohydrate metabolism regulator) [Sphingomonas vulcanisoli]